MVHDPNGQATLLCLPCARAHRRKRFLKAVGKGALSPFIQFEDPR
jgi:hypothetical protein